MDIIIDRASVYNRYLNDDYSQLTLNDVIYVGGSPPTKRLPGLRFISNFRGCLKEVRHMKQIKGFLEFLVYSKIYFS